jgi:predicted nucleic acid-binding protein
MADRSRRRNPPSLALKWPLTASPTTHPRRYNLGIYDAMIAASALAADCDTLWSEDMQHGMVLDGRLRVADPFRGG